MDTATIWEKYADPLRGFILKKVKDRELANDLLQEVFVRVHTNLKNLREEDAVESWVYHIARHLVIDHFRKHSVSPELRELPVAPIEPEVDDPSHCLKPMIKALPQLYSRAIVLSEIKGLKQAEIAAILEISVSGVKSRIQRGKKLLQQAYMDCCDYQMNQKGYLIGEGRSPENCKFCP